MYFFRFCIRADIDNWIDQLQDMFSYSIINNCNVFDKRMWTTLRNWPYFIMLTAFNRVSINIDKSKSKCKTKNKLKKNLFITLMSKYLVYNSIFYMYVIFTLCAISMCIYASMYLYNKVILIVFIIYFFISSISLYPFDFFWNATADTIFAWGTDSKYI